MRKATGAFLLSCLLGACSGKADGKKEEKDEAKEEAPKVVAVVAARVRTASFEQKVRALGSTVGLPNLLTTVSPAVEGIVAEVLVKEGDVVSAAQPLVRLDDRLAQRDLAERKAAQQEFEAALVLLKAPPRDQDRKIAALEVDRAQVAVGLAQAVVARLVPLEERKEISEQELFEAKQKLEEAKILSKVAEARRDLLLAGARPEAIAEAEAKVVRAEAAVATASVHLSYFVLNAPRAGIVNAVLCHQGQLLPLGAGAVELVDASQVAIDVGIPTRDASLIKVGQEVRILFDGEETVAPDVPEDGEYEAVVEGKVAYVGLQASPATGTLPVRVLVGNPHGRLRLGMMVEVEIVVAVLEDVLAVPNEAILSAERDPELAVVRDGKVLMLRPRVGVRHGGLTQVTVKDLEPGDLVITRGAYDLGEGTPVKVEVINETPRGKGEETRPGKAEDEDKAQDTDADKDSDEDKAEDKTGDEGASTTPAVPSRGASPPS